MRCRKEDNLKAFRSYVTRDSRSQWKSFKEEIHAYFKAI